MAISGEKQIKLKYGEIELWGNREGGNGQVVIQIRIVRESELSKDLKEKRSRPFRRKGFS